MGRKVVYNFRRKTIIFFAIFGRRPTDRRHSFENNKMKKYGGEAFLFVCPQTMCVYTHTQTHVNLAIFSRWLQLFVFVVVAKRKVVEVNKSLKG